MLACGCSRVGHKDIHPVKHLRQKDAGRRMALGRPCPPHQGAPRHPEQPAVIASSPLRRFRPGFCRGCLRRFLEGSSLLLSSCRSRRMIRKLPPCLPIPKISTLPMHHQQQKEHVDGQPKAPRKHTSKGSSAFRTNYGKLKQLSKYPKIAALLSSVMLPFAISATTLNLPANFLPPFVPRSKPRPIKRQFAI